MGLLEIVFFSATERLERVVVRDRVERVDTDCRSGEIGGEEGFETSGLEILIFPKGMGLKVNWTMS